MSGCSYCDEDLSSKKDKLEHELDKHSDEMSSHEKSDKKSKLNKLDQKQKNKNHNRGKTLQFAGIGVLFLGLVAGAGLFAYQNMDSFNPDTNTSIGVGEPVHWHAEYQITVCGENQVLEGGPVQAHTHGETTFHLEGVRQKEEQAKLDWILDSLGGELEEDSIMGRESCNGDPANLTVKANGNKIEDHLNYVPRNRDFIRIDYS